ncbi:hypothetical protein D3C81_1645680 [compost metagenome]
MRRQVARAHLEQAPDLVAGGLAAIGLQEDLAQLLVHADGRVRGGVHPAGDAAVDLPQGDLVGHQNGRLQPGAAGLLDVVGRGFRGQARAQHAFAGQVEVPRVLEHRPGSELADALAVQVETLHQAFEGAGQHVLVARRGIDGIGAGEGDAVAADDGDPAQLGHGDSLRVRVGRLQCRIQD